MKKTLAELKEIANRAYQAQLKKSCETKKERKLLLEKIKQNGDDYVEKVRNCFEQVAEQGCGSFVITVDRTYDEWQMLENCGSDYSLKYVVRQLLRIDGVKLKLIEDHYDAISYELTFIPNLPLSEIRVSVTGNVE